MSNEITLSASLAYSDSEGTTDALIPMAAALATITTKKTLHSKMSVTTAELALPLGNLASLGWCAFVNRDPTNFIEIRTSTGAVKFCKLPAGKGALLYIGSGVTAPFVIADTANCQLEYFLCAQ